LLRFGKGVLVQFSKKIDRAVSHTNEEEPFSDLDDIN
jgi:hypothetical protein